MKKVSIIVGSVLFLFMYSLGVDIKLSIADCTIPVGHYDYCSDPECGPCDFGQGDCDNDGECEGDLICLQVTGGIDTCGIDIVIPVCPPVGHLDYCRVCGPCAEGEGDCDSDSECQSGLDCHQVPGTDVCRYVVHACPPVGHLDYCRECGPCELGQGDCDNDSECQGDLICLQVTGGTDTCGIDIVIPACPPVGHLDYCRVCGPCTLGEGDCDSDSECETGLRCYQVTGTDTCWFTSSGAGPPLGHIDYCQVLGPCAAGEGDCDSDSECEAGLSCVQVIGTDVCCPHPLGHLDYCRDCGPCASGQGDCDNDGECQSGLTCPQVPGTDTCQ